MMPTEQSPSKSKPLDPRATPWHTMSVPDVMRLLGSDSLGLDGAEAAARATTGPNALDEGDRKGALRLLAGQFTNAMVLILSCAAVLSLMLGKWLEAGAVLAIVVLFALLGFHQEYRAERAVAALRRLSVPSVRVRRRGAIVEASARDLVPGDVVALDAGNVVPADLRLIDVANLRVEEAALTGESEPTEKAVEQIDAIDAPLGDRSNMAYSGTVIAQGRGVGVVVAIGMRTELGRIATLLQTGSDEITPLQRQLDSLGKQVAIAGALAAALVLLVGIALGETAADMLLTAVSVAVAVVPEGLPAVVTLTLAVGAQRMLVRDALIRRLPAVETLGSVTVICSDKTGTLTENRMTATVVDQIGRRVALDTAIHPVPDVAHDPSLALLLAGGVLCNDGYADHAEDGSLRLMGDSTETALLAAGLRHGITRQLLERALPRVAELPFDSGRKRMTTIHRRSVDAPGPKLPDALCSESYVAVTKGAVDQLLECASMAWIGDRAAVLTDDLRATILQANEGMARQGMRVLGVAYRPLDAPEALPAVESDLIVVGMFGIIDPPRPEVRAAVARCRDAGIRPVMVTGDHPLTAAFIARELGIGHDERPEVVSGSGLDSMAPDELSALVTTTSIFARVTAAHKVAKEASDMVLRDDNFSTIVAAVEEGRVVYDNLRRFVGFAVAGNIGKVAVMLCWPLPFAVAGVSIAAPGALAPLQLLWLNLMTDGVLGVSMGMEPPGRNVMRRPPRRPHQGVLSGGLGSRAVWVGLASGTLSLSAGFWYYRAGDPQWQTIIFMTLALLQVFQAFASRSETETLWSLGFWSNRGMVIAAGIVVALQFGAVYSPVGQALGLRPLAPLDLLVCFVASLSLPVAIDLHKVWARRRTEA